MLALHYTCHLQYGVDGVFELIGVSVGRRSRFGRLTNSLTTLAEPLSASLCTLAESLFDDFDFDDVFGADMLAVVEMDGRCLRCLLVGHVQMQERPMAD
jgi:hypothetical protein